MVIAERMFFLHLLSDLPETFGKLCTSSPAKRIDNVFDKVVNRQLKIMNVLLEHKD